MTSSCKQFSRFPSSAHQNVLVLSLRRSPAFWLALCFNSKHCRADVCQSFGLCPMAVKKAATLIAGFVFVPTWASAGWPGTLRHPTGGKFWGPAKLILKTVQINCHKEEEMQFKKYFHLSSKWKAILSAEQFSSFIRSDATQYMLVSQETCGSKRCANLWMHCGRNPKMISV